MSAGRISLLLWGGLFVAIAGVGVLAALAITRKAAS